MLNRERMEKANALIAVISRHGRQFFKHQDRVAHFIEHNGRLYFVDAYSQKEIYVHHDTHFTSRWKGFTNGGTLRAVIEHLRDYITERKPEVNMGYFGPWHPNLCGGDLWGYGDDMELVRQEIKALF